MKKRILTCLIALAAVVPVVLALDAEDAGEAARSAGPYATIGGGVLVIVGVLLYFLPTFISGVRRREEFPMVLLVDLLFGWTGIGWLIAMYFALRTEAREGAAADVEERVPRRQSYGR